MSRRIEQLKRERYRWADMTMDGSVPADIAKEKQDALGKQLSAAEVALAGVGRVQQDATTILSAALRLLERCAEAYRRQVEQERRQMNQACFTSIDIDSDGMRLSAAAARQPIFQAVGEAARNLQAAGMKEVPESDSGTSSRLDYVEGSTKYILVGAEGLEPPTPSV